MNEIASEYGILDIDTLNTLIAEDIKEARKDATRIFSDDFINSKISKAEKRVFGHVGETFTLANIGFEMKSAIYDFATFLMEQELIKRGIIANGELLNESAYFEDEIAGRTGVKEEKTENTIGKIYSASEYGYYRT